MNWTNVKESLYRPLRECPQRVRRRERAGEGGPVADPGDELRTLLQLEQVVDRVPETMRPVEERKGDEDEQIQTREGMGDERMQRLVIRTLHPAQGKRQPEQEDMNREH